MVYSPLVWSTVVDINSVVWAVHLIGVYQDMITSSDLAFFIHWVFYTNKCADYHSHEIIVTYNISESL